MIQTTPTTRQLLAGNQLLPEKQRQSMILLEFLKPIAEHQCEEFLRIQLTESMLSDGEGEFYQAEIYQATRTGMQKCKSCQHLMTHPLKNVWKCINSKCKAYLKKQIVGPLRGVVTIQVFPDFISHTETFTNNQVSHEVAYVNRCCLVLDRRYDERTLAAVKRTASALCDLMGWKMK